MISGLINRNYKQRLGLRVETSNHFERFVCAALLSSLSMRDEYPDYKEKYDALLQEFEDYKHHVMCKYNASSNLLRGAQQQQRQNLSLAHDKDHDKTQLNLLKVHNSNLEERIRMINNEMLNKERALQEQLEHHRKVLSSIVILTGGSRHLRLISFG